MFVRKIARALLVALMALMGFMAFGGLQRGLPAAAAAHHSAPLPQGSPPEVAVPPEPPEPLEPINGLIPVQMPDLASEEVLAALEMPPSLLPEHAQLLAEQLLQQTAQAHIRQLEASQARQQNQTRHYRFRPDLAAIEAFDAADVTKAIFNTAQSSADVAMNPTTESKAEAAGCGAQTTAELAKQLMALHQYQTMRQAALQEAPLALSAALRITIVSGYSVFGTAAPNTFVTLRLVRDGALISTRTTKSTAAGEFRFFPQYQYCPTPGYDWQLALGDEVTVEAGGETASTKFKRLSVEADPTTNRIYGVAAPSHVVTLKLFQPSLNCSEGALVTRTVTADAAGNFSLILGGKVDFDNSAYVIAEASEQAGGHAMQVRRDAFGIRMYSGGYTIYIILPQGAPYTTTLWRGDTAMMRRAGQMPEVTDSAAQFFASDAQLGDVWVVESAGLRFSMAIASVSVNLNLAANQIQVATQANSRIRAYLYRSRYGLASDNTSNCGQSLPCSFGLSDRAGNLAIAAKTDLVRGDYAYVESFDSQGNRFLGRTIGTRSITARPGDYYNISVRWYPYDFYYPSLRILHKDANGAIKREFNNLYASDGLVHSDADVLPGDVIEASNGMLTETMSVQAIDVHLDSNSQTLTGNGSDGPLAATLYDFDPSANSYTSRCAQSRSGKLPLGFANAQVGGRDYASVVRMGPDGHYTEQFAYAFYIYVNRPNYSYVFVRLEQPNNTVTATLRSGDVVKSSRVIETETDNYAYFYYGNAVTFAAGDTLDVVTSSGNRASFPITDLNIAFEGEPNHAFGTAPANQHVIVEAWRSSSYYSYWIGYSEAASDANGRFDIGLGPAYVRSYCARTRFSHPCVNGAVTYFTPQGHAVAAYSQYNYIAADTLEPDSTPALAAPYTGPQAHTLHSYADVDLVSFEVSQEAVNRRTPYLIQLSELGWDLSVSIEVYDEDLNPLILKTERERNGSSIGLEWTPVSAGRYYLYVSPGDTNFFGACDSHYTLSIIPVRTRLSLPLVRR